MKNADDTKCLWDKTTLRYRPEAEGDHDPWYIPRCNKRSFFYVPPEGSLHHFTFCPFCGKLYELRPKAK